MLIASGAASVVVMASMAFDGDVRKNLLDRTDAEKVFRNRIAVICTRERGREAKERPPA